MREYETMIITKPDLPEAELTKMVGKWESIITANGGQIIKKDTWGVRRLAYPIQKVGRGAYFVFDFAATQADVQELDRVLKFDEGVLRSQSLKLGDTVDVENRRVELQKLAEAAAARAAEAARDRADGESFAARRGN
jgi:small subunit ribosomal protein S6